MKRCLDCGYHTHSYVDGVLVCDNCGRGGRLPGQHKSATCVANDHSSCHGRAYAESNAPDKYGQVRKHKKVQCECRCHKGVRK